MNIEEKYNLSKNNKILEYLQSESEKENFIKFHSHLIKVAEEIRENFSTASESLIGIGKNLESIQNKMKFAFENTSFKYQAQIASRFIKRLKEIYDQTPETLLFLSKIGWYLGTDTDMRFIGNLKYLLDQDKLGEVNTILLDHYKENFDDMIEELKNNYPKRKTILNEIQVAHKKGLFYLSVPTILTQVDGIAKDRTNKIFFNKNDKYLPIILNEISDLTIDVFLSPISNETPIMVHEKKMNKFSIKLNRHAILHGSDYCYGSEENSLKCFSFLKYLSDILVEFK